MHIVVDEWLTHYLSGEEGTEKQALAFRFIQDVVQKCDCFATMENQGLVQKIWNLARASHSLPAAGRQITKIFFAKVVFNSEKFIRLRDDQINEIAADVLEAAGKDTYLVKTHLSLPESLIVTTDERLRQKFSANEGVKISLAEQFMREYDP